MNLINTKNSENHKIKMTKSLSLKTRVLIAVKGLKSKIILLIASLFCAIISYSFLTIIVVPEATDVITTELNALYAMNIHSVYLDFNSGCTKENSKEILYYPRFSNKQLELIKEFTGNKLCLVESCCDETSDYYSDFLDCDIDYLESDFVTKVELKLVNQKVFMPKDTTEEEMKLIKDERFINPNLCKLPTNESEIAITNLNASAFIDYGYKSTSGVSIKINTPDDLIGKTYGSYTITGVYATEENVSRIKEVAENYNSTYKNSYLYAEGHFFHNVYLYGSDTKFSKIDTAKRLMIKLSGDLETDRNFLNSLNLKDEGKLFTDGAETEVKVDASYNIDSPYHAFIVAGERFMSEPIKLIFTIFSIVLIVLSAILLFIYMFIGIGLRRRELVALNAIEIKNKDIVSIQLLQSLFISLIIFITSLIITSLICLSLNNYFYITIFNIGLIPLIMLVSLSFGITLILSLLSFIRLGIKNQNI